MDDSPCNFVALREFGMRTHHVSVLLTVLVFHGDCLGGSINITPIAKSGDKLEFEPLELAFTVGQGIGAPVISQHSDKNYVTRA